MKCSVSCGSGLGKYRPRGNKRYPSLTILNDEETQDQRSAAEALEKIEKEKEIEKSQ